MRFRRFVVGAGVAVLVLSSCSGAADRKGAGGSTGMPSLDQVVVSGDDLPGWHQIEDSTGSTRLARDDELTVCMGLPRRTPSPSVVGAKIVDPTNSYLVTSVSQRVRSPDAAKRVRRVEERGNYPECLARSVESAARSSNDNNGKLLGDVTPMRLQYDVRSGEIAVRLSYTALVDAVPRPIYLDRYAVWHLPYVLNVTFFGSGQPFDSGLKRTILDRLRRTLGMP